MVIGRYLWDSLVQSRLMWTVDTSFENMVLPITGTTCLKETS